jgi:AmmeMemoRadiSam system protein A
MVQIDDLAHEEEHSLEVQLPFLQLCLDRFQIVPLLVGACDPQAVAAVLERCWGGPETCVIISSDLSHYHADAVARQLDRETARRLEAGRGDLLSGDQACGCIPIQGLLLCSQTHLLRLRNVDLRNSAQATGRTDRVVGYGAFVSEPQQGAGGRLSRALQRRILQIAAAAIRSELATGAPPRWSVRRFPAELQVPSGVFVTLRRHGELRGCVGNVEAAAPLAESVMRSAGNAAFRDRRFPPLDVSELRGLEFHISLLSPLEPLNVNSERELVELLRPGVEGLVLRSVLGTGVFLPSVWSELPDPQLFVARLKQKAGWPAGDWPDDALVERFTARHIHGRLRG